MKNTQNAGAISKGVKCALMLELTQKRREGGSSIMVSCHHTLDKACSREVFSSSQKLAAASYMANDSPSNAMSSVKNSAP